MFGLPLLLIVLLLPATLQDDPRDGEPGVVYETLGMLQESIGQGNTYTIRERDLNAFLAVELERQAPPAIKKLGVALEKDRFTTQLKVDMDELDLSQHGTAVSLLGSLITGVQELVVVGSVDAREGRGSYTTHEASLNGITLPGALVDLLLSAIGQRLEPPFDPTQPFRLPNGIQSVTVFPGRLELTN